MMHGYGMGAGADWLNMVSMGALLFVSLLIILAGYRIMRDWPHHTEPTADEIIRRRFARGEITRDEFEEMRTVLGQTVQ